MAIEKYVAWKTRALFWRNGRAFKEPKANVQEPEGIENIEPSIKKVIDQMIGNFNKWRNFYTTDAGCQRQPAFSYAFTCFILNRMAKSGLRNRCKAGLGSVPSSSLLPSIFR